MSSEIKPRIVYVLTRTNKADDDDTDIYVGSTSRSLNDRLCCHRCDATRVGNENNKLYSRMRAVGLQNWEIISLLSRTCDIKTIRELERKWCKIMSTDLNTNLPILKPGELNLNKEAIKQYQADYYKSNKDAIRQRHADYYKSNKDAIKQYYKSNKEAISKYQSDYRESNKQNKVHYCELCDKACGSNMDLQRHLKTSKHFWKYIYSVH